MEGKNLHLITGKIGYFISFFQLSLLGTLCSLLVKHVQDDNTRESLTLLLDETVRAYVKVQKTAPNQKQVCLPNPKWILYVSGFSVLLRAVLKDLNASIVEVKVTYFELPGQVAQLVAHLIQEPEVPGSIPGPATYFHSSFHLFKKGSYQ